MKWKIELITFLTAFFQMSFLLASWQLKFFHSELEYLYQAIIVLILGIVGVIILKNIKSTKKENDNLEKYIKYVAVFIYTLGVYLVFIPAMAIILSGGIASLLLILGFFMPTIMNNVVFNKKEKSL